ncbi:MAG: hypothetical protein JRN20_17455 [Nitrososphaerota archaeon]|nr:hypothetical protein [Nitrososphaerota archaeon]
MNLRAYTNRNMFVYLGLSIPALLLQGFFIIALLKIPIVSLSGLLRYADLALQYVPWLVLFISIFAVVTFRTSILLTLLVVSYFISSILSGSASLTAAGYYLNSGEIAALVVAASFCSLIGFGFSRAARIEKRKTIVMSKGPIPHQVISIFLELFLPAIVAVGLILATIRVVGALRAETLLFPAPLSTIFSSFLLSPIITIIIAAITLALVRDIVEPWVLYYTINQEDAQIIMEKEAKQMVTRKGLTARFASGGMFFSIVVVVIILALVVWLFGYQSVLANFQSLLGIGSPTPEPNFLIRIDNGFLQFENLLSTIIHLLWG